MPGGCRFLKQDGGFGKVLYAVYPLQTAEPETILGVGISGSGGAFQPGEPHGVVFTHTLSAQVCHAQAVHGIQVILRSSLYPPAAGFIRVLADPIAQEITFCQLALRLCVSLVGRFPQPFHSFGCGLGNAAAGEIAAGQLELRCGITCRCGFQIDRGQGGHHDRFLRILVFSQGMADSSHQDKGDEQGCVSECVSHRRVQSIIFYACWQYKLRLTCRCLSGRFGA